MGKILEYTIIEKVGETSKSIVWRAKRDGEDSTVIIKVLKVQYPSALEVAKLRQEYELVSKIDIEGIVKVYEITQYETGFAIILEDIDGISMKSFLSKYRLELKGFLEIAIQLSETIGFLHSNNIVHMDIKPHNIIINTKNGKVKITDFGIAAEFTRKNAEIYNTEVIEGTLPYISPEQTGRVNRTPDYRTDLYSLGVTFYEMLTGEVPFKSDNPTEVIHYHIAKKPIPPNEINPSISGTVSNIILKLLSKNAEDRYQSGFGLLEDLKECLLQLNNNGKIDEFILGNQDMPVRFNMPQILIGREKEKEVLNSAFGRVAASGNTEIVIVTGASGIGKSSLVNEVQKSVFEKKGYFISGKNEKFSRDVPYSAVTQAFEGLVKQMLSEGEEKINIWKEKLLRVLEPNGKVIADIVPEIEIIIGKQPEMPDVEPKQSQNRFNLVLKNFISTFASKEHPLVIFLDDLQWSDQASLSVIKNIITETDIKYMLFIGAYRDTEIDSEHNLTTVINDIKKKKINIETIVVSPLDAGRINQLITSIIKCREDQSLQLAELVHKKTGGNPFFINQFLKILYNENLIELIQLPYDQGGSRTGWTWDIEKVKKIQVTDNVLDMMAGKIAKFPKSSREIIKIASCMGIWFDIDTLSSLIGISVSDVLDGLTEAIKEGLVTSYGEMYKFNHDRIQEAAYSMIQVEEKSKLHYAIGSLVLHQTSEEQLQEKLLFIVDHLNEGKSQIISEDEMKRLAELNLLAGIKAKSSSAYDSALKYLKTGIYIIGEDGWKQHYNLTLSLYEEAVEAANLCTDYDEMERLFKIASVNSRTLMDKVKIYSTKIHTLMSQNKLLESVEVSLEFMKLMGIRYPIEPGLLRTLYDFIKTKVALRGLQPEDFLNFPKMSDPYDLAVMRILTALGNPVYWAAPKLLPLIIFRTVRMAVKRGNSFSAPYFYAGYALVLVNMGYIETGCKYGEMSLELIEKMGAKEISAKTYMLVNAFIRHRKKNLSETLPSLVFAYQSGLETGDFEYVGTSLQVLAAHSIWVGVELTGLSKDLKKYTELVEKLKQRTPLFNIQINHQTVLNLVEEVEDPCSLKGRAYDEDKMIQVNVESADKTVSMWIATKKVMLCYLFHDYNRAVENSRKVLKDIHVIDGTFNVPVVYFYYSLSLFAQCQETASGVNKNDVLAAVQKNQKKLKVWAQHAPMNHLHKYNLVEAEIARVKCDYVKAMELYDKAIKGAYENGFVNEEALANEVAARFYLELGMVNVARMYMSEAYNAFYKWGAEAKLRDLENTYPNLINKQSVRERRGLDGNISDSATLSNTIDLSTVMKVYETLSSEINLDRLLNVIMKTTIENAGAQKGFLLFEKEGKKLFIEASGSIEEGVEASKAVPLEECTDISSAIVNYVNKTRELVILNNAYEEGLFINDGYVKENKPKSILCAPIMYQGKMEGIIYLENNLTKNAFTRERLEILKIISSQAAISIENARLFNLAIIDRMTNLINNTHLQNILEIMIKQAYRYGHPLSLLMLDIDHFKIFNDTYGHQAGDEVLKRVAGTIRGSCRKSDVSARYGGEEFSVILPETDISGAEIVAEKLREKIEAMVVEYNGMLLRVTASVGAACIPPGKPDADKNELIKSADRALYESKNQGRNRVTVYSEGLWDILF